MRAQVKSKLDEILDRIDKIIIQLTPQEKEEFRKALIREIQ